LKIEKYVDVDKLIKGLYMDNLEFMQWFKRFFEMAVADIGDYDPIERRSKGKGGAAFNATHSSSSSTSSSCGNKTSNTTKKAVLKEVSANIQTTTSSSTTTNNVNKSKSQKAPPSSSTTKASTATIPNAQYTELKEKNDSLMKNLTEVKLEMDGLEKERDFYFDKLRDIEMMLQDMEESGKGNEMSLNLSK
jgi:RP/EB family microtubule-associated protein